MVVEVSVWVVVVVVVWVVVVVCVGVPPPSPPAGPPIRKWRPTAVATVTTVRTTATATTPPVDIPLFHQFTLDDCCILRLNKRPKRVSSESLVWVSKISFGAIILKAGVYCNS